MATEIAFATEPERQAFVKPTWGLTHAIPEGVTLAWGARAIYAWCSVTKLVTTKTGKVKIERGRKLTSTTYEPSIDLLWDRMGWSSGGAAHDIARANEMSVWLNTRALPEIKALCRRASLQPSDDGPTAIVEFTEAHGDHTYTIKACPNGSCGYLYIAAWRHVQ